MLFSFYSRLALPLPPPPPPSLPHPCLSVSADPIHPPCYLSPFLYQSIVVSLQGTVGKVQAKLAHTQKMLDLASGEYQVLTEKQRRYHRAVKRFQELCEVNARLSK